MGAELIAYEAPLYQVLALETSPPTKPAKVRQPHGAEELRTLREILANHRGRTDD